MPNDDAHDALAIAAKIAQRELSVVEHVRRIFERIKQWDSELHAFVSTAESRALRDAERKDAHLMQLKPGARLPAFFGVAIGVKDLNFVRGMSTSMGSRGFGPLWSPFDDRSVASLRRAGFIIVGKTATSELGAMPVTEPETHAPTRNPHHLAFSAGGSSGGSAAGVASGMLPIAHGSDGGGSIRIPAACCGLFSLKPSRGLLPNAYGLSTRNKIYTCGGITRSVRDLHALTEALARRPLPLPAPRKLNISFCVTSPFAEVDAGHERAVLQVADVLRQSGHSVRSVPPFPGTFEAFVALFARMIADVPLVRTEHLQPVTRWLRTIGQSTPRRAARETLQALTAQIDTWFGNADLMLTPTIPGPPPLIGAWKELDPEAAFQRAAQLAVFTAPFNISGQPAGTIPLGTSELGLPRGVQFAGRRGDDAAVLAAMDQAARLFEPLASTMHIDNQSFASQMPNRQHDRGKLPPEC